MTDNTEPNKIDDQPRKIKIIPKDLPGPSQISPPEGPSSEDVRGLYVTKKRSKFPSWLIAVLIALVLIAGIFWILPRLFKNKEQVEMPVQTVAEIPRVQENIVVVTANSSWLYKEPRRGAVRVAEVLFNEGLELLDASDERYLLVNTRNGLQGYILRTDVSADASGLDPKQALLKVIIITSSKNIMSHTQGGTVIAQAPLGSVLYADYQDSQVLRIRLPQGVDGWISKHDVFIMDPEQNLPEPDDLQADLVSTALTFNRSTWVPNGITTSGIDMPGVLYLACSISGVEVQRDPASIAALGEKIDLPINQETNSFDLRYAQSGDILILNAPGQQEAEIDFALILPDEQVLLHRIGSSTISTYSLTNINPGLAGSIKEIRRLPNQKGTVSTPNSAADSP